MRHSSSVTIAVRIFCCEGCKYRCNGMECDSSMCESSWISFFLICLVAMPGHSHFAGESRGRHGRPRRCSLRKLWKLNLLIKSKINDHQRRIIRSTCARNLSYRSGVRCARVFRPLISARKPSIASRRQTFTVKFRPSASCNYKAPRT